MLIVPARIFLHHERGRLGFEWQSGVETNCFLAGMEGMNMDSPAAETTLAVVDEMAERYPERLAVADVEQTRTFEELRENANELAAGLRNLGVGPDDRVAILVENRVEWVEVMVASHRLGASIVGVSTWATERELEFFLSHSGAGTLVATHEFAGTDFVSILADMLDLSGDTAIDSAVAPALDTIALLEGEESWAHRLADLPDPEALAADPDLASQHPNDPEDEALLLYTSGSTSRPKGVPLLHGGHVENGYQIGERMHLTPEDRIWLCSPLFWSYGVANALGAAFTHGAGLVLQAPFEPERAIDLIDRYECTVYYGMPNMARDIVEADGFDPDRLHFRTGTTIGPPEDIAYTIDQLDIPELCNIYGSTETYGNCAVTDCKLPRETRLHTQGHPLEGQDIVIADPDTGERLPQGEVGEIRVGGRITPGYHDAPEKNAEAFDEEGYLKMGDLGRLDEDGRVQFRGRLKNVIKTGGINVSPLEIEEVLLTHSAVDQVFVVGIPDEEKDEIIGAAIVTEPGESLTREAVLEHCASLAAYKRPDEVAFVDADVLPTTDTGKIQRNQLAETIFG